MRVGLVARSVRSGVGGWTTFCVAAGFGSAPPRWSVAAVGSLAVPAGLGWGRRTERTVSNARLAGGVWVSVGVCPVGFISALPGSLAAGCSGCVVLRRLRASRVLRVGLAARSVRSRAGRWTTFCAAAGFGSAPPRWWVAAACSPIVPAGLGWGRRLGSAACNVRLPGGGAASVGVNSVGFISILSWLVAAGCSGCAVFWRLGASRVRRVGLVARSVRSRVSGWTMFCVPAAGFGLASPRWWVAAVGLLAVPAGFGWGRRPRSAAGNVGLPGGGGAPVGVNSVGFISLFPCWVAVGCGAGAVFWRLGASRELRVGLAARSVRSGVGSWTTFCVPVVGFRLAPPRWSVAAVGSLVVPAGFG